MRVYSSMMTDEFVAQLRQIAIDVNAGPAFIDQLDRVGEIRDQEEELIQVGNELAEMEDDRDDYKSRFELLLSACKEELDPSESLLEVIKKVDFE